MSAELVTELQRRAGTRAWRARAVTTIGPVTSIAGACWALVQPERITLLHPHGQGFWWLFSEPPLYVVLVGLLFSLVVAPGLLADLDSDR